MTQRPLTPGEFDAALAELGFSEEMAANLMNEEVSEVRLWRAGEKPIPDYVAMSIEVLRSFRKGMIEAREKASSQAGASPRRDVVDPKSTEPH